MKERRARKKSIPTDQTEAVRAYAWLLIGLAGPVAYLVTVPTPSVEKPISLVVIYVLSALGLDLFVGASRRVTLQRIAPAVTLALLVTPGIPAGLALVVDLLGTLAIVATSRITYPLISQAGRALLPATLTAVFLYTRSNIDLTSYLFAAELFLLASLATRSTDPPFRSDLFLVVSYPAIALMLRSLVELHLAYILLAVPLLFLLTTVDTEMLLRYFQLKKRLDDTQVEVKERRKAQRKTELESRRKGVLLNLREQQLSLLNGLGKEMDAAHATDDLGHYLLQESVRLTGADRSMILFCDGRDGPITAVISAAPQSHWGVQKGGPKPPIEGVGIRPTPPWRAPIWEGHHSFLTCQLGGEGWLFLAAYESDAFPSFLNEFFSAVGRHAGSSVLALRRLTELKSIAKREVREKEKVAEQNHNLRLLIGHFEGLTEDALSTDYQLRREGVEAIKGLTGADAVLFGAGLLSDYPNDGSTIVVEGKRWPSYIFLANSGPSGNLLCLSRRQDAFSESQVEWCTLLHDFLDKTLENTNLHRQVQASYAKLERTQEEIVLSSQWAAAGRLAANAAHELNTPLGAIRLAAEQTLFFLQRADAPDPALQGVQSIVRSVDRCREVTDRLLITSRPVDQGDTPARPEVVAVIPLIRDAIASVEPYLKATGIKLADHRLITDHRAMVVIQDLYWAVVNILKNAIDALNDSGQQEKWISVAMKVVGNNVEITISDNGPGIPDDQREKIFEPFFTTKKLGQGNGLGLSLSRTNLRHWGGDIQLGEVYDKGAAFVLTIPLAR